MIWMGMEEGDVREWYRPDLDKRVREQENAVVGGTDEITTDVEKRRRAPGPDRNVALLFPAFHPCGEVAGSGPVGGGLW